MFSQAEEPRTATLSVLLWMQSIVNEGGHFLVSKITHRET
jgi:hypothetical protein